MPARRYLLLAVGAGLIAVIDQWTKHAVSRALLLPDGQLAPDAGGLRSRTVTIAEGWLNFRVVGNRGAAWGLFRDLPDAWRIPFFVSVAALSMLFIVILYRRASDEAGLSAALIAIMGGAIGNVVDRVQLGYVVDFIDVHVGDRHWPTFNLADVAISTGLVLLLLELARGRPASRATEPRRGSLPPPSPPPSPPPGADLRVGICAPS